MLVKPNVRQFTDDGYGVTFEDGSHVEHIDLVLMATGFNIAFPYLDPKLLRVEENHVKNFLSPDRIDFFSFRSDCSNTFGRRS